MQDFVNPVVQQSMLLSEKDHLTEYALHEVHKQRKLYKLLICLLKGAV